MALSTILTVNLNGTSQVEGLDLATLLDTLAYVPSFTFADGVGAAQVNRFSSDIRTLTSGASETIVLNSGLLNTCGVAITVARVKIFILRSFSTNSTNLTWGPAASSGWVTPFGAAADRIRVVPAGISILVAPDATGYASAAGSSSITVTNAAGASASYDLVVVGANT